MRRYLLDTGIAQDFINDRRGVRPRVNAERLAGNRIGICTPVLGELWSGVECSNSRDKNLQKLRQGLSRLTVWPYDEKAAAEFGRIMPNCESSAAPFSKLTCKLQLSRLPWGTAPSSAVTAT